MEIRVLGTYPEELSYRFVLSSYLVNGELAIDAGALALGLPISEQVKIHSVILTHVHLDHIASLPLFIDNTMNAREIPPTIYSITHNIAMLKKHLFNNVFWPDLPSISKSFFKTMDVEAYANTEIPNFTFHFFPVNHPVPTMGVVLREKKSRSEILFSSDTSICDAVWTEANRCKHLKAMFVEVSFPNAYQDLALSSGHLTPALLEKELLKLHHQVPIFLTHYKSQYIEDIEREIGRIKGHHLNICRAGEKITFD